MFFSNFSVPSMYSQAALHLKQTINSLHVLISSLMSPRCSFSDSKKIDIYVKIFLSNVHRSARLTLSCSEGDAWLTNKANPVSLLNLARQIEEFGPVRWYYEGVCERYIQVVKPYLVKNMRRTPSYFQQKLILLHKLVFMKRLSSDLNEDGSSNTQTKRKGYFRYASYASFKYDFDNGYPISCFKLDIGPSELIWVAFGRSKEVDIIPLMRVASESHVDDCCGLSYFKFEPSEETTMKEKVAVIDEHISCYGLLFPLVKLHSDPLNHRFTCIFSDWDVLKENNSKGESLLKHSLYIDLRFEATNESNV